MSYWFKVELNVGMIASGRLLELQSEFRDAYLAHSEPVDMALFCGRTEWDGDNGIAALYISPASSKYFPDFILKYFASTCKKPAKEDITLLVGPKDAYGLLDIIYMPIGVEFE